MAPSMYFIFLPLKIYYFHICFCGLKWSSQEVGKLKFDHEGVKYVNIYFGGTILPPLVGIGLTSSLPPSAVGLSPSLGKVINWCMCHLTVNFDSQLCRAEIC